MSTASPLLRELDVSVVERDVNAYLARHPAIANKTPAAISLASLPTPTTALAESALVYSRSQLDDIMFNHSCRVYYIGQAMAQHLNSSSSYHIDSEAYYLTSLLHDLGVGPTHLSSTRLSFEFYGAILARDFILEQSPASRPLADEVSEAIIRHTNFVQGSMTTTGQLIQLSTTLDVIGANSALIGRSTYREIEQRWPRLGFNLHFAQLMDEEMRIKPWSHTTTVEAENGFCAKIRANPFTAEIDHQH
jgi:cyanamide hydratase